MKLTKEQREEIIADLVSNENNVFSASDQAGFEALGDERLSEFAKNQEQVDNAVLVANAALEGYEGEEGSLAFNTDSEEFEFTPTENSHDDDSDDDEDEEEEIVETEEASGKKGKKAVTKNQGRPRQLTDDEWMKRAPANVRRVVANAVAVENQQKDVLIDSIMQVPSNKFTENQLLEKEVGELESIAALCGNVEQTPLFNGAAGGSVQNTRRSKGFDDDEVLQTPAMNFSNEK